MDNRVFTEEDSAPALFAAGTLRELSAAYSLPNGYYRLNAAVVESVLQCDFHGPSPCSASGGFPLL